MGIICLILIIPVKAVRFVDAAAASTLIVGIIPSILGPAGFFFLLLSSPGRFSRLSLLQVATVVIVIACGLEFAQLFARPGILAAVYYTFDWLDVLASILSVCVSYAVASILMKRKVNEVDRVHFHGIHGKRP